MMRSCVQFMTAAEISLASSKRASTITNYRGKLKAFVAFLKKNPSASDLLNDEGTAVLKEKFQAAVDSHLIPFLQFHKFDDNGVFKNGDVQRSKYAFYQNFDRIWSEGAKYPNNLASNILHLRQHL